MTLQNCVAVSEKFRQNGLVDFCPLISLKGTFKNSDNNTSIADEASLRRVAEFRKYRFRKLSV